MHAIQDTIATTDISMHVLVVPTNQVTMLRVAMEFRVDIMELQKVAVLLIQGIRSALEDTIALGEIATTALMVTTKIHMDKQVARKFPEDTMLTAPDHTLLHADMDTTVLETITGTVLVLDTTEHLTEPIPVIILASQFVLQDIIALEVDTCTLATMLYWATLQVEILTSLTVDTLIASLVHPVAHITIRAHLVQELLMPFAHNAPLAYLGSLSCLDHALKILIQFAKIRTLLFSRFMEQTHSLLRLELLIQSLDTQHRMSRMDPERLMLSSRAGTKILLFLDFKFSLILLATLMETLFFRFVK